MKNNPLFSDSSKMWTDSVSMKIELEALFLYENEEVYFRYFLIGGGEKKVPLRWNGEGLFVGETNLAHQKEFSYHFLVNRNGQKPLTSPVRQARTSYFLSEVWTPDFDRVQTGTQASSEKLGSIIDRWGL